MFGKKPLLPADNTGTSTPKSFWETVISTTPVLLTVVATLLAGLSSSEMTKAQYYRAMAAQYQSKAGDQWGFFQAKRIRGSNLEQTADLLHPSGEPVAQSLPLLAERLQSQIRNAEKQTERMVKLLAAGRVTVVDYAPSRQGLQQEAEKVLSILRAKAKDVVALQQKIAGRLQLPATKEMLVYLSGDGLPESAADDVAQDGAIQQACQGVRDRKADAEIVAMLRELPKNGLADALGAAAARAAEFEKRTKPIARASDDLGRLVQEACMLARAVHRSVRELAESAEQSGSAEQDPLGPAAARLVRTTAPAATAADVVQADFKAARHNFKARCYEREARQNQSIAELYELEVRVNSVASERHRQRSKHFFYGMLAAQAGVTVASLALAVRRKSVLWSLATAAGIGAIFFSGYVYLCM